ncbi:MAG: hypothetical protein JSS07_04485 [Proteobacteria bacterium]|nr:hypothetical protein [Pseudomonadota bacterium]
MNTAVDTIKSVILFQSDACYPVNITDETQIISTSKEFFPLFWAAMLSKSHLVENTKVDTVGKMIITYPYIIISSEDAYNNLKEFETIIRALLPEIVVKKFQKWVDELFEKIRYDFLHIEPFKHWIHQKVDHDYKVPIYALIDLYNKVNNLETLSSQEKNQFIENFEPHLKPCLAMISCRALRWCCIARISA